jgi:hypothetical protein
VGLRAERGRAAGWRHRRPSSGAEWSEGCPRPFCLCQTSDRSEGLERRVASLPSPQQVSRNRVPKVGPRLLMTHLPTKSLPSNPTRRSGQPTLCPTTQRGGAANQLSIEQPCKAERSTNPAEQLTEAELPTKSLSSNPARWSGRPTHEAERPTNSLSTNSPRRSGRPNLCRPTHRGGATDQLTEVERPTMSSSSNSARRKPRYSTCRVLGNRVPETGPSKRTHLSTKSLPTNSVRRIG